LHGVVGLAVAVPEDPGGVGAHERAVPADEHAERCGVAVRGPLDERAVGQRRERLVLGQESAFRIGFGFLRDESPTRDVFVYVPIIRAVFVRVI